MKKNAFEDNIERSLGINFSSVLLPEEGIDMQRWSVVACDQYTSEPEYWQRIDKFVGNSPSTLRLIFPEAYLESESEDLKNIRISKINQSMNQYLTDGLFQEFYDTVILVERSFKNGHTRHGLVLSVDLERYDYSRNSQSLIRATEGTIIERLPPRIKIREHAKLEIPHIMLLIDDKDKTVIEPLLKETDRFNSAYSFDLIEQSGSIRSWLVNEKGDLEKLVNALAKLADPDAFKARYGLKNDAGVLLFAAGDGNHSLATAKACWENLKRTLSSAELIDHPARFALVEVVNVHDSGLVFEPINRILFNVDPEHLTKAFCDYYENKGCKASIVRGSDKPDLNGHAIKYTASHGSGYLAVECPVYNLDVGTLQGFLDVYIKSNSHVGIDYVHGDEITERLGKQPGNMGFFLSKMDKNELFRTVILDGVLPRKTFSMGEASEKRFYLEARKII